jgi:hypothetical protein
LDHGLNREEFKQRKSNKSDLRYGLAIVCSFLLAGLALGYLILHHQHRKVILHVMQDPRNEGKDVLRGGRTEVNPVLDGPPRFVTVVMPSVVKPEGISLRLRSIADTWGPDSRVIYVVHNVTEYPSASVVTKDSRHDVYPQLILVPPEIDPEQGVLRLNHVIRTVHKIIDPDFAFFVNDHTFVIPEHLCHYLSDKNAMDDMYSGHALKHDDNAFNSGAAGYLLSRTTMTKLIKAWDDKDPKCALKEADKWLQGNPGLVTANCLKDSLNVSVEDTREDQRLHRFHAFGLVRMALGKVDQWYINKHQDLARIAGFDESYSTLLFGADCCSKDTISFHYVEHLEARVLFNVRHALVKNPDMTDNDLKASMIKEWPAGLKDLGVYSRGLPDEKSQEEWEPLLAVVRKISSRSTQMEC